MRVPKIFVILSVAALFLAGCGVDSAPHDAPSPISPVETVTPTPPPPPPPGPSHGAIDIASFSGDLELQLSELDRLDWNGKEIRKRLRAMVDLVYQSGPVPADRQIAFPDAVTDALENGATYGILDLKKNTNVKATHARILTALSLLESTDNVFLGSSTMNINRSTNDVLVSRDNVVAVYGTKCFLLTAGDVKITQVNQCIVIAGGDITVTSSVNAKLNVLNTLLISLNGVVKVTGDASRLTTFSRVSVTVAGARTDVTILPPTFFDGK